jgi:hypothetical protein
MFSAVSYRQEEQDKLCILMFVNQRWHLLRRRGTTTRIIGPRCTFNRLKKPAQPKPGGEIQRPPETTFFCFEKQ